MAAFSLGMTDGGPSRKGQKHPDDGRCGVKVPAACGFSSSGGPAARDPSIPGLSPADDGKPCVGSKADTTRKYS